MFERHLKRDRYFAEQVYTTEKYVIPFIKNAMPLTATTTVLEIGCGEGGNLKPFLDMGCSVTGVDYSSSKIDNAIQFFRDHPHTDKITLVRDDIYNCAEKYNGCFDLIYMRDVIEHIHDQDRFMEFVKPMLKPGGMIFLGFPPWQNPFGGHQQICQNRIISKLPFIHLLPYSWYRRLLKMAGEPVQRINNLLEIKETGITIERFTHILNQKGYVIQRQDLFFINPNYEIKFGLKPRVLGKGLSSIKGLRNFYTTSAYYLVQPA
ncbi:MAG: class I SAM-dependent methyltransferase [Bacteroidota bacterium]|nr:class I SAM-dependent methyltransferase [Bacteroidota bacterium]